MSGGMVNVGPLPTTCGIPFDEDAFRLLQKQTNLLSIYGGVSVTQICQWILDLRLTNQRKRIALTELCKRRLEIPPLAVLLWNAVGSMRTMINDITTLASFLQTNLPLEEKYLDFATQTMALMQTVAGNMETNAQFVQADIPSIFLPFVESRSLVPPLTVIRLAAFSVLGAALKANSQSFAVVFTLRRALIPICLESLVEDETEESRCAAAFIIQRVLCDRLGREFVCESKERFTHVLGALTNLAEKLKNNIQSSAILYVQLLHCFLNLIEDQRALNFLRSSLPEVLRMKDRLHCRYLSEIPEIVTLQRRLLRKCRLNGSQQPDSSLC